MIDFATFTAAAGGLLLGAVVILGWLFRSTGAPFGLKLALPTALAALALATPFAIKSMMGYPVESMLAALPKSAKLIAFVEHDRSNVVDLWLQEAGKAPRAWRIDETLRTKRTLNDAKDEIENGNASFKMIQGSDGAQFEVKGLEMPKKE